MTKKCGGAVVRNRMRRYLREAYRRACARPDPALGFDIVFNFRQTAAGASFGEVEEDVKRILARLVR